MKPNRLSYVIAVSLLAGAAGLHAQTADTTTEAKPAPRASVSSTSNNTNSNDTQRVQQLGAVQVQAHGTAIAGGLMSVQTAPKAVSTITREAIVKASPGSNFTQMIESIPGVNASTDDVTGLNDGNYSIRGFTADEIGATVNGAPINDAGSNKVYATEYGDTENMGDITVLQGVPDVDMPDAGAAGGHIAWATIDPTHKAGVDFSQSWGSNDYRRTFMRLNTGDLGPVRSWISWSDNSTDKWRGGGDSKVTKVDAKSILTIDNDNSISASVQYNREVKYAYLGVTKAQSHANGYHYDYDQAFVPGSRDSAFYGLHTNPFKSLLVSLDGEFTFTDTLHLSVVPYFQYGDGGGGSGNNFFTESTSTAPAYEAAHQDLTGDGVITNKAKALAYQFSYATTYRPGVIAKFNQDLSADNSLEYGVWYEKSRQQNGQEFGLVDQETGFPVDIWSKSNFITYPGGETQKAYDEYTTTTTKKGFVTDTWTPTDQLTFTGGLSYLHVEREGYALEFPNSTTGLAKYQQIGNGDIDGIYHKFLPTVGIKFAPDERNQFYYGVGKTYRAPPTNAVFLNAVTGRAPNQPESSWNNDLGWRFYGDDVAVSAMLYHSNFNNKTEGGYDSNTGQTFYTEIPHVKMQGFDTEATWRFADSWKVYGSYTYTQAKMESNLDTGDDGYFPTKGKDLFNTPRSLGYAALSYDNSSFWASLTAKYRSSIYGDYMNTQRAGGYTTFGLNAGYNLPDFSTYVTKPYIKFNMANLTDHHAFTNANNASAFLAAPGSGYTSLSNKSLFTSEPYYSVLEPRTFMITIGASFF